MLLQEDGTAGDDSEEEGSAEAKSESLDSDEDDVDDEEDEEAASRRLNVRTGEAMLSDLWTGSIKRSYAVGSTTALTPARGKRIEEYSSSPDAQRCAASMSGLGRLC